VLALLAAIHLHAQVSPAFDPGRDLLPDSPGALQSGSQQASRQQNHQPSSMPCPPSAAGSAPQTLSEPPSLRGMPCPQSRPEDPLRPFVSSPLKPLTARQKAHLAVHDVIDPFNILTIGLNSGFTVGIDSHTAYGPGLRGFGKNVGVSFVEDASGEAIGTFAVCTLFHEDPRYFRMPHARPLQRVGHVFAHIVVAQGDNGRPMLNFENLITYPAAAELANLYVPGINGNGPSTVERILTGLATEPIGNFIAEFLPDVARRIHVRIVIVQQILNGIAAGQPL